MNVLRIVKPKLVEQMANAAGVRTKWEISDSRKVFKAHLSVLNGGKIH